jgi:two-component system response regulator RegX3
VEAEANHRDRIAERLRNEGFAVTGAATGSDAVAQCHRTQFDAISLDVSLPDMSGRTVVDRMRERGLNQQTPIVVATPVNGKAAVTDFEVVSYNGLLDGQARAFVDRLTRILNQTSAHGALNHGENLT